jgi:quercetin dioxygenase-like cupin family protein
MKKAKSKSAKKPSRPGAKGRRPSAKRELKYIAWNALELEAVNPLFQRHYVFGQNTMLARILLKKGCIVPLHRHHNEQITFVLEGALKFWIDGKEIVVNGGEVLAIPPNVPHKAEALADTIDFDVFSPPRADWIGKTDQYLRNADAKHAKAPRVVG